MDKKEMSACLKTIKLITSSIFARKQPFMIVDCRSLNKFYYTNIERERVALYHATADDVLSLVKIKSEHVTNDLYKAFPIFEKSIVEIDLRLFSKYLNKALKNKNDEFPELKVHEDTRYVTMYVSADEPEARVGVLLSELDIEFYDNIMMKHLKFSNNVVCKKFHATTSGDDKVSLEIVEIEGVDPKEKLGFAFPVKDGFNIVSTREYMSKRNIDPMYHLDILLDPLMNIAKTVVDYSDDWLDASTIMPGTLWFLSKV